MVANVSGMFNLMVIWCCVISPIMASYQVVYLFHMASESEVTLMLECYFVIQYFSICKKLSDRCKRLQLRPQSERDLQMLISYHQHCYE